MVPKGDLKRLKAERRPRGSPRSRGALASSDDTTACASGPSNSGTSRVLDRGSGREAVRALGTGDERPEILTTSLNEPVGATTPFSCSCRLFREDNRQRSRRELTIKQSMDVVIIGGAGHVGLPLGLAFAEKGKKVLLYDINEPVMDTIRRGEMPFIEYDAEPILKKVVGKALTLSSDIRDVAKAKYVIIAIGTPVDEYLNPKLRSLLDLMQKLRPHLKPEQTIIIRSTVYPRTCAKVLEALSQDGGAWKVAYAPERIAQGYAIRELRELPQLVAGIPRRPSRRRRPLRAIAPKVIPVTIERVRAGQAVPTRGLHPVAVANHST